MLGLSRVGVTTEISAGGSRSERAHFKKRIIFKGEKIRGWMGSESQTELNTVRSPRGSPFNANESIAGGEGSFDWAGIKATTVITTSTDR